ncbi:unnamed protein product [Diplocarpon coronariae]
MGHGIWDMGYGIWDMGYGIWDMGYGIRDRGYLMVGEEKRRKLLQSRSFDSRPSRAGRCCS